MLTRQKVVTYGIPALAAATIAVAAGLTPWSSSSSPPTALPPAVDTSSAAHQIDVVFAIDTTGSMGGLIDGAKRTVWSIAGHIKQLDSQADVRIGLVDYRDTDSDSGYVTRDYALSGDLDQMFVHLSSFRAHGGGDTPEHVDAALYDALHKMQWRPGAKKMIFLVGDAPPAKRGDVPTFDVLARQAADRQIVINTIRAGLDGETERTFQQIAMLGNGDFSNIQQDGGVNQIATPYDAKLAELSTMVDSTAVIVGSDGVRGAYAEKMAAGSAAPAPAKADRAGYYMGKGGKPRDSADIVGGDTDLSTIAPSALPEAMRSLSKDELKAEVATRSAKRAEAQKEIEQLVKQRADYLKKNTLDDEGFDKKVKKSVEKSMAKPMSTK